MKKTLFVLIIIIILMLTTGFVHADEIDNLAKEDINANADEGEDEAYESTTGDEVLPEEVKEIKLEEETETALEEKEIDNEDNGEEENEGNGEEDNREEQEKQIEEEQEQLQEKAQDEWSYSGMPEGTLDKTITPEVIGQDKEKEKGVEPIEVHTVEAPRAMMMSSTPQTRSVQNGWDESGPHYYIDGVAQKGFVEIEGKTYYFNNNGEFKKVTGLVKNTAGEWKYVRNGIVDFNATGLVQNVQEGHRNKGKYFYVENGIFKSNAFGMVKGIQPNSEVKGNWYYVQNGQFKGTGNGLVKNIQANHKCNGNYYYVENGKWRNDVTGLVKGIQPNSEVKGNWYYVKNGQYRGTGTGLVKNIQANHINNGKYYYVENGRWKKTANGFYHDGNGKNYAIKNGAWLEGYNGLYKNPVNNKYYYLENGIWERDYNGSIRVEDASGSSYWCHIKNGMKLDRTTITYFRQSAGSWASKKYGGKTFADTGCVPTSLAMVISAIQNSVVYPDTVGDYLYRINEFNGKTSGVTGVGTIKGADAWEVNYSYIHSNSDMDAVLRAGKVLIVNVGPGTWCGAGATHAIVCDGYSNGRTYVYDPAHPDRNGWYATGKVYANPSTDSNDYAGGTNIFAFW